MSKVYRKSKKADTSPLLLWFQCFFNGKPPACCDVSSTPWSSPASRELNSLWVEANPGCAQGLAEHAQSTCGLSGPGTTPGPVQCKPTWNQHTDTHPAHLLLLHLNTCLQKHHWKLRRYSRMQQKTSFSKPTATFLNSSLGQSTPTQPCNNSTFSSNALPWFTVNSNQRYPRTFSMLL